MEIFKCYHQLLSGGANKFMKSDLIYQNGKPVLVLEWDEDRPAVTLKLDPASLTAIPGEVQYAS